VNAREHRIASALALAAISASSTEESKERLPNALAASIGGYCFGTLPDFLEPATSPNHRQFFHSLAFAGILGYGLYRLYNWVPETPEQGIIRAVGLVAGGAYLIHLALDSTTRRSLPLIGRIQ
jgi:membrane-bound metal-dependent hydrolase YbcI (DUF457 family)